MVTTRFSRTGTGKRNVFLLFVSLVAFGTMAAYPVGSPVLPPEARSR